MIVNPLFPMFLMSQTADPYEWLQVAAALVGLVLNSWLLWMARRDRKIASVLVQSPRLHFVAYTHLRQSWLAWLVQGILLAIGLVSLFLPSPILLVPGLSQEWLNQAILRNFGMVSISVLTALKAWFNWRDQHTLLMFTDFDLSLHAAIADVKQHAELAYHEANTVNQKLAEVSAHIEEVQKVQEIATHDQGVALQTQGNDIHDLGDVGRETLGRVTDLQGRVGGVEAKAETIPVPAPEPKNQTLSEMGQETLDRVTDLQERVGTVEDKQS